jgi:hypothetical protein
VFGVEAQSELLLQSPDGAHWLEVTLHTSPGDTRVQSLVAVQPAAHVPLEQYCPDGHCALVAQPGTHTERLSQ